jgi:hypothetical protein
MKSPESMMVVFMDNSTAIRDLTQDQDDVNNRLLLPDPPISRIPRPQISAPKVTLMETVDDHATPDADGDQTGRSMLFGRYMGQISARVERAWIRPRSSPGHGAFECRVQISQDRLGQVQEITLQECNADLRWQASLVQAIQSASPLPAPPDPAVFSNLLTMQFDSEPYRHGAVDQGFEPAAQAASSNSVPFQAAERDRPVRVGFKETDRSASTKLTIVGTGAVQRVQAPAISTPDSHRDEVDRIPTEVASDDTSPR